jgi:hypothetical protein
MLDRYKPFLRIVCVLLAGLIIYRGSQMFLRRPVLARSSFAAPVVAKIETPSAGASTNSPTDTKETKATNAPPKRPSMPGMPGMMGGGGPPLPPEDQASIEKIKKSQLLGPDIKPPPMALLGIAGADVFLRAPNGQTGLVREGEELGGVKIIKIGTNRVLVEENKQQKELTIFEGFGSGTLMPPTQKE